MEVYALAANEDVVVVEEGVAGSSGVRVVVVVVAFAFFATGVFGISVVL